MSVPLSLLPQRVTWVVPATTTDPYGNAVPDWADTTDTDDVPAWIEQRDTVEQRDGRDTFVTQWLFIANELGISGRDRIVWGARTFEIDGEVSLEYTPAAGHHVEARLLLVEG